MSAEELIEYLSKFPADSLVGFLVADVKARLVYDVEELACFTDTDHPVMGIRIGNPEDFDEEETATAEEAEKEAGEP